MVDRSSRKRDGACAVRFHGNQAVERRSTVGEGARLRVRYRYDASAQ